MVARHGQRSTMGMPAGKAGGDGRDLHGAAPDLFKATILAGEPPAERRGNFSLVQSSHGNGRRQDGKNAEVAQAHQAVRRGEGPPSFVAVQNFAVKRRGEESQRESRREVSQPGGARCRACQAGRRTRLIGGTYYEGHASSTIS